MKLVNDLQEIFDFLEHQKFAECTIEKGDLKVTIKRAEAFAAHAATPAFAQLQNIGISPAIATATPPVVTSTTPNYKEIKSPMIGTFYRQPKPGAPAFVQEGDMVREGQTLCVIEAMKLFNEIESDVQGKIIKILVADGSAVQYDQPLFWVEP